MTRGREALIYVRQPAPAGSRCRQLAAARKEDGRGGRGKQGALLVAGFRQSDYYTQVPKNQGSGRVWKNILRSFLPFAFAENERGGEVHVVCISPGMFVDVIFFIEPVEINYYIYILLIEFYLTSFDSFLLI